MKILLLCGLLSLNLCKYEEKWIRSELFNKINQEIVLG